jgi:hypothetical protein
MPLLTLETTLAAAINEVETFVLSMAIACHHKGWRAVVSDNAPSTFKELKSQCLESKIITIERAGSDKSIYSSAYVNSCFRFYHDVTHLTLDKGFSVLGESTVIDSHKADAVKFGLSPLAMRVLEADTIGQVLYYQKHKTYVLNQRAFLDSCLQYGVKMALNFKH